MRDKVCIIKKKVVSLQTNWDKGVNAYEKGIFSYDSSTGGGSDDQRASRSAIGRVVCRVFGLVYIGWR